MDGVVEVGYLWARVNGQITHHSRFSHARLPAFIASPACLYSIKFLCNLLAKAIKGCHHTLQQDYDLRERKLPSIGLYASSPYYGAMLR